MPGRNRYYRCRIRDSLLEKLVKEDVQMELPDKLRGHIRTLDEARWKESSARVVRWKDRKALDAPTPTPGSSTRSPQINHSDDSPDVVDLFLLEQGESSIIPGWDMLRRRVVEEPDLTAVQVPPSREAPDSSPEPDRRNADRRVTTWLSDTLDDKDRQWVVQIVSGDTVRSAFRNIGRNRVWELEIGSQAQNRDV
ncbi:hypothetical protein AAG570_006242 [Ranatra chinensis]|uniref:Uncharacterized protein n=1 Tax=Ranatra chinensis TaxID=642074 RepID=A0ABD0YTI3_9HEMI